MSPDADTLPIQVVGIGSPQGDDQAAWQLVERCRGRCELACHFVALGDPSRLLDHFDCQLAIVVDACRSGAVPGTVSRLEWPDQRIQSRHGTSTHGLSVSDVLHLAAQLDQLPSAVVVFGIELQHCRSHAPLSRAVQLGLDQLQEEVVQEIHRFHNS